MTIKNEVLEIILLKFLRGRVVYELLNNISGISVLHMQFDKYKIFLKYKYVAQASILITS